MSFLDRLKHAWNAFTESGGSDPPFYTYYQPREYLGMSSTYRPDRIYLTRGQEKSIISTVYNRIALDVSGVDIRHVKVEENER